MSEQIKISAEPLMSMNDLMLRVVIERDDQRILDRVIVANANNSEGVIALCGEAVEATGLKLTDMEREIADHVLRARDWWARTKASKDMLPIGFQGKFLTSAALEESNAQHRWLIKHILVASQPAMVGGPKKSLKTSIMVDMAISLGTGTRFFGKFDVPERVRVAVLSGESGEITLRETALRVAKCKGVRLGACDVLWGFELPRLGVDADLMALTSALRDNQVKVVFIDPAYLCLLAGSPDLQASNMFQVGPLLLRIAKVCQEVGTTLVLLHHTTKPAGALRMQAGEALELEDLAYSGFQEFARQWILINRRQVYEHGAGKNLMWMNIGGSAGHSGLWGVDIDEGKLNDDFGGRRWVVQVRSREEAMKGIAVAREEKKGEKMKAKRDEQTEMVLSVLKTRPDGDTQAVICKMSGLQPRVVAPLLVDLERQGKVIRTTIKKKSGKGATFYDGWRLARDDAILALASNNTVQNASGASSDGNGALERAGVAAGKKAEDTDWLDDVDTANAA